MSAGTISVPNRDFSPDVFERLASTSSDGWAAEFIDFCDSFWSVLTHNAATEKQIDMFCQLLVHQDSFTLAQHVIPEIRSPSETQTTPLNDQRLRVVQRLRRVHTQPNLPARNFDPLYQKEKEAFSDIEMYRASLLLHRTAEVGSKDWHAIREWLAQRPRFDEDESSI